MKCPSCGAELPDGSIYCPNCGWNREAAEEATLREKIGAKLGALKNAKVPVGKAVKRAGSAGVVAAGAGAVGAYYLGKGIKSVAGAPIRGAGWLSDIIDRASADFKRNYIFVILGGLDFYWNVSAGRSDLAIFADIFLTLLAFSIYRSYIVAIPAFLELAYPFIAVNYGWWNTVPAWLVFGIIMLILEMPRMEMTAGQTFTLSLTALIVILFFVGPGLNLQNLQAAEVNTGPLGDVKDFVNDRVERGTFRWGGFVGDLVNCVVPDWMGGNNNCTALQKRIDPTYRVQGKTRSDLAPVKYEAKFVENMDDSYYVSEPITLLASFSIEGEEYPIEGMFNWTIDDIPASSVVPSKFTTLYDGVMYRYAESIISAEWPEGTFKDEGTYETEFRAEFNVKTESEYRTWFVKYNPYIPIESLYEQYDYLRKNRIPKSEKAPGPVDVLVSLGQKEAPMIWRDDGLGYRPRIYIQLKDKNAGSKREHLRYLVFVEVKAEDWFSLDDASGCHDFVEDKNTGSWKLKKEKLEEINRRLGNAYDELAITCPMSIKPDVLFRNSQTEPSEVRVAVRVSYVYEVTRKKNIEIKDLYSGFNPELAYCPESESFARNELTRKDIERKIDEEAWKKKIPRIIARSVAETESNTMQYDRDNNWKTKVGFNREYNGEIKSIDYGVMQVNWKSHNKLSQIKLECSYEYNIEKGMEILKAAYNKCGKWEPALNAYNSGGCYWDRDNKERKADGLIWQDKYSTVPYSNRVLESCKMMFDDSLCEDCIKRDKCPPPEKPEGQGVIV